MLTIMGCPRIEHSYPAQYALNSQQPWSHPGPSATQTVDQVRPAYELQNTNLVHQPVKQGSGPTFTTRNLGPVGSVQSDGHNSCHLIMGGVL